jgi:hypothetical protein
MMPYECSLSPIFILKLSKALVEAVAVSFLCQSLSLAVTLIIIIIIDLYILF